MDGHDDYVSTKAANSSILKYILPDEGGSPEKLMLKLEKGEEKSSPYLTMGSTVHKWIEDREKFAIADFDRPSDAICDIVDLTHADGIDFESEGIKPYIIDSGYYKNLKIETRLNKVWEAGKQYANFLVDSEDKIALTAKERDMFNGIQQGVMKNKAVSDIIMDPDIVRESEYYFWWYEDGFQIRCKSLLDLTKTTQGKGIIWDVKTSSKPLSQYFHYYTPIPSMEHIVDYQIKPGNFFTYRTYRQLAFYREAVMRVDGVKEVECNIIVIETKPPYECAIFNVDKYMNCGAQEVNTAMMGLANMQSMLTDFIPVHKVQRS